MYDIVQYTVRQHQPRPTHVQSTELRTMGSADNKHGDIRENRAFERYETRTHKESMKMLWRDRIRSHPYASPIQS